MPEEPPIRSTPVEKLRQNLACPECRYCLNGLIGDIVRCPECGVEVNVAKLITHAWAGKWRETPGFSEVLEPLAWTVFAFIAFVPLGWFFFENFSVVLGLGFVFVPLGWIAFAHAAVDRFGWWTAFRLALLSHIAMMAYLAAVVAMIGGMLRFAQLLIGPGWDFILWIATGILLWRAGRAVEKYIAAQCLNRHLREAVRNPFP